MPAISSKDRVASAAKAAGLAIDILDMPASARTADEAAAAARCTVSQIVKSLVFLGAESDRVILLLVSGANRVDEEAVSLRIGERLVRPSGRVVRERTGFAIGGVSPLGHEPETRIFMDTDLFRHDVIWAAAGAPSSVFASTPDDLARATNASSLVMTA